MANMASACALVLASGSDSQKNIFGSTRSWKTKEAATTCALVTVSTVSICIMVVGGVWFGREHALSSSYEPTRCSVLNVTFMPYDSCSFCPVYKEKFKDHSRLNHHNGQNQNQNQHHHQHHQFQLNRGSYGDDHSPGAAQRQQYGPRVTSPSFLPSSSPHCSQTFFSCLQIMVTFWVDSRKYAAILHRDSVQGSGPHSKCSYPICESERNLKKYADRWIDRWYKDFNARKHHQASSEPAVDSGKSLMPTHNGRNYPNRTNLRFVSRVDQDNSVDGEENGNGSAVTMNSSSTLLPPRQHTFECYYNRENYASVIEKKVYTKWDVIHSMLWPGLAVLVCVVLFLRLETKRRRLTFCGRQDDDILDDPDGRSICRNQPTGHPRHDFYPASTTVTLLEQSRGVGYGSVICDLSRPSKRHSEQLYGSKKPEQRRRSLQQPRHSIACSHYNALQHQKLKRSLSSKCKGTQQSRHLFSLLQPSKGTREKIKIEFTCEDQRTQLRHQDSELSTTPSQSADQSVSEIHGDQTKLINHCEPSSRCLASLAKEHSRENDSILSSAENIGECLKHKRRSSTGNLLLLPVDQWRREYVLKKTTPEQKFRSFQALSVWL